MKVGDRFIYTGVTTDFRFGKECQIVGEIGGCWEVQTIGFPNHKTVMMNKNLFPMPVRTKEEIEQLILKNKKLRRVR